MQNKGFVKVFAVLLTLVCFFYLSFTYATWRYDKKIAEVTSTQGEEAGQRYADSLMNERVWLGSYTLKQCREMEIGLGLDLKGGMNVILEVSVPDVVKALADHKTDALFNQAIEEATQEAQTSQSDFITLFVKHYKQLAPNGNLAELFATQQLKGQVTTKSTDAEVERVLRSEVKAAIDNSFNVLRTRIDRFGVAQPNIQAIEGQMGRIMVELPGIKEPERVRKLLQGSANLEFWETYATQEVTPFLQQLDAKLANVDAAESVEAEENAEEAVAAADSTEVAEKADSAKTSVDVAAAIKASKGQPTADATDAAAMEQLYKEHPLLSRLQLVPNNYGCIVGYAGKRDMAVIDSLLQTPAAKELLPRDLSLKWGVKAAMTGSAGEIFELYAIRITERNGRAPLEGDVIVEAKDDFDDHGHPCVSMTMNTDGARRWAALTGANINRSIAIVLDDYVYSAPNVNGEITGGRSQITGSFTPEDTRDLANVLKSGKMPAPAHIVADEFVGPTLGQESINQGIISFIVAFVLLMFYMCAIYGFKPGMVANSALIVNLIFTLGILASFQAALTMSGIAGMVLSLGMAVDANVLIYERTKEELRAGKSVKSALADGYSNAFSAIFDSNLTSIITGIILFNFGTGPIRGFATTLIIGIVVSFFTAVFLTRLVYDFFMSRDKWLNLTFSTGFSKKMFRDTSFNFMGSYKKSFAAFGALAVISFACWGIRGLSQSIDFTGGRNFMVVFDKEVEPETVRELLANSFEDANTQVIAIGSDKKTLRISTNYRITETGTEIDTEIESKLFTALKDGKLLSDDLELSTFINRDERAGGSIISSQKVGPSIAENITRGAYISVALALIAIFLYILIRFRNVAFSVGSVVALCVDTLLIIGAYAACWGWIGFSLEIDQTFIGAILTAIGYSINDKVVVFDRIREYLGLYPKRDRQQLFNDSLNTTLARTLNTSISTLIVLVIIFAFGGNSIRSFAFAMMLGVVFGTLSSIFLAAPVAYLTMGKKIKEEEAQQN
ncbi:MAG: protein translocase subunit SecDF [Clostridium sp.]|nr:protein translocase subunit SecDF [Clostridium sp.]